MSDAAGHRDTDRGRDRGRGGSAPFAPHEWQIAWRYMRARRREGGISVIVWYALVGIALAVGTLIVVMAVMVGFRAEFTDRILGAEAGCSGWRTTSGWRTKCKPSRGISG